ncbi:CBS domain-containing protein [Kitasatospora sp. NPDC093679]|uniref:CBS domain-containing protein n=1 Tax=Kitasatospora sp. NPDC093679 TaxID=3154983 RepID=UPI003433F124
MQRRTVEDVMTHDVVAVRPETAFKEIVGLFHRNAIAAVPVVDAGYRPIGIVSEADLIREEAALPDQDEPRPHRLLPHADHRVEGETAESLMSSPVVTARAGWSLVETARLMHRRKLKRLPVVDTSGRLTGIVSRSDLLSPFLRTDNDIREEIERDVLLNTLWLPANAVRVTVDDGVVTLSGTVERKSLVPVIAGMCRSLDGVVAVRHTLGHRIDDTLADTAPPAVRTDRGPHPAAQR